MATDPQFYLDKVLEVSTSERPPVLDYNGGVNEVPAPAGGATYPLPGMNRFGWPFAQPFGR
jgi:hypothetical protein